MTLQLIVECNLKNEKIFERFQLLVSQNNGTLLVRFAENRKSGVKISQCLNRAALLSLVFIRITLRKHEMKIKNANFFIVKCFLSNCCLGSTVMLLCFQLTDSLRKTVQKLLCLFSRPRICAR